MLAQTGQVHHEGVFKLPVDIFLDIVEIFVFAALRKFAAQYFFPVGTPDDFFHPFPRNQTARAGRGSGFHLGCRLQVRVVKRKGLVIVVNLRQIGIRKNAHQELPLGALAWLNLSTGQAMPSPIPLVLVFPLFGITDSGLGLHVVKPRVLHPRPAGPYVFTSDRTGVAPDAFI